MLYRVIGKRLLLEQQEDDSKGLIYNQDLQAYKVLDKGKEVEEINIGDIIIANKQNVITTKFKQDTIKVISVDNVVCYISQGE